MEFWAVSKRKGRGHAAVQGGSFGFGMRGQKSWSGPGVRKGFEGGQMSLYRRILKLRRIAGGDGELNVKLEFNTRAFSKSVKEKLEASGFSLTILQGREKWVKPSVAKNIARDRLSGASVNQLVFVPSNLGGVISGRN